jgi:hypothetical protein
LDDEQKQKLRKLYKPVKMPEDATVSQKAALLATPIETQISDEAYRCWYDVCRN